MRIAIVVALVWASLSGGAQQATPVSVTYPAKPGPGRAGTSSSSPATRSIAARKRCRCWPRSSASGTASRCTVLFSVDPDGTINPKNSTSLSDPAALDSADAIVMLLRFRAWPDETMTRFDRRLQGGMPIVALRTSTHAFNGLPKGGRWETWNYNNPGRIRQARPRRDVGHPLGPAQGGGDARRHRSRAARPPDPARRHRRVRRHRRLRGLPAGRREDPRPRVGAEEADAGRRRRPTTARSGRRTSRSRASTIRRCPSPGRGSTRTTAARPTAS